MATCPECLKSYSTTFNLNKHLASSKGCSKANITLECEFCTYQTGNKSNMARHVNSCKYTYAASQTKELVEKNEELELTLQKTIRKMKILETKLAEEQQKILLANEKIAALKKEAKESLVETRTLKEEIVSLKISLAEGKGKISVYKERPTPTINTTTNYINPKLLQVKCDTIRPFTIETVREDVQAGKFTFDRFIQAEKGLVEFLADIISQDTELSYVCTDISRQKFHRLVESREWKDDNGASFLNKVLDELKEPTAEYHGRICDMMVNGDRDTADFLRNKTKSMVTAITLPKSRCREATFNKVRNEVKKLATI